MGKHGKSLYQDFYNCTQNLIINVLFLKKSLWNNFSFEVKGQGEGELWMCVCVCVLPQVI